MFQIYDRAISVVGLSVGLQILQFKGCTIARALLYVALSLVGSPNGS